MEIRAGGLDHPAVVDLLRLHLASMAELSPPESVHALDLSGLSAPDVMFWAAWDGEAVLGCGALKAIGEHEGEIKSMRTAPAHLRKGVAAAILDHIVSRARARGYRRLSLETGTGPAFAPAHAFYQSFGFVDCGAFGDYPKDDPFSRFMSLAL
jgi:putative acetyltransferase